MSKFRLWMAGVALWLALPAGSLLGESPASALAERTLEPELRALLREILERNPELARARHALAAVEARVPQAAALPDPMATLGVAVIPPETRVGPVQWSLMLQQTLPWFGKLRRREQAAVLEATVERAELEARALELMRETREVAIELAFSEVQEGLVAEQREHLIQHEQAARARYVAGLGLQQEVIKIQVEITRDDELLLVIAARRRSVLARLNALRDRPAETPLAVLGLPQPRDLPTDPAVLRARALAGRPELAAARAAIAAATTRVELARKDFRPDLTFGLGYSAVGERDDEPGRLDPPPDNGEDDVMVTASLNLPIWRRRLRAGVEEAEAMTRAAEESERARRAAIEAAVGDHGARLPLLYDQWRLLQNVMLTQAEEASSSAEASYAAGRLGALDLLDAEHVRFQVETAAARAQADWAITLAALESAIAGPLDPALATQGAPP